MRRRKRTPLQFSCEILTAPGVCCLAHRSSSECSSSPSEVEAFPQSDYQQPSSITPFGEGQFRSFNHLSGRSEITHGEGYAIPEGVGEPADIVSEQIMCIPSLYKCVDINPDRGRIANSELLLTTSHSTDQHGVAYDDVKVVEKRYDEVEGQERSPKDTISEKVHDGVQLVEKRYDEVEGQERSFDDTLGERRYDDVKIFSDDIMVADNDVKKFERRYDDVEVREKSDIGVVGQKEYDDIKVVERTCHDVQVVERRYDTAEAVEKRN